ncbi:hypothetical protein PO909_033790 [Leuciscus waleckii]
MLINGKEEPVKSCVSPSELKGQVFCHSSRNVYKRNCCFTDFCNNETLHFNPGRQTAQEIKKWLGLPCALVNMALFGRNILELSLKSINLGYKQEKMRLLFELRADLLVRNTEGQIRTGRKRSVTQTVEQATNWLKHLEIVGFSQPGRTKSWLGIYT